MKLMDKNEFDEKISLLKEGQIVEIDGDWFGAHPLDGNSDVPPCNSCGKACEGKSDVGEICLHLNLSTECDWYLVPYPSVLD